MTGGSGRLGRELQALLDLHCPPRQELDLLDPASIERALDRLQPDLIVHAAAYTDVARAERDHLTCWRVNVGGTQALVRAALKRDLPLLHISTDYVFWGDTGGYREEDPPGPVRNYYALSKLAAEAVVVALPRYLIVRTSFRAREWPHPAAFHDLYTSQDYVDVLAPELALAIQHFGDIPIGILHLASERRSALELARQRRPDVRPASRLEAEVALPADISLNSERWKQLKVQWTS